jgi:hypothetical protein
MVTSATTASGMEDHVKMNGLVWTASMGVLSAMEAI